MKKQIVIALVSLAAFCVIGSTVSAEQAPVSITQEKIDKIRERCTENLATLNRLHQTDAFLRTNRGDLYRTISDKLMVPLNRRLASNQLDGGQLINLSADFNKEYNKFYTAYTEYDNAVSKVLTIDCDKAPVTFYNALVDARTKRDNLSKSNQELMRLVQAYGTTFEDFRAKYSKENP